mmetsp:Transcript_7310/g.15169  ORF Transcript_7310/g.15169 Transcript_7310/m.15169 type:complete len:216 (-) Transcript_7310:2009-2656(-)
MFWRRRPPRQRPHPRSPRPTPISPSCRALGCGTRGRGTSRRPSSRSWTLWTTPSMRPSRTMTARYSTHSSFRRRRKIGSTSTPPGRVPAESHSPIHALRKSAPCPRYCLSTTARREKTAKASARTAWGSNRHARLSAIVRSSWQNGRTSRQGTTACGLCNFRSACWTGRCRRTTAVGSRRSIVLCVSRGAKTRRSPSPRILGVARPALQIGRLRR